MSALLLGLLAAFLGVVAASAARAGSWSLRRDGGEMVVVVVALAAASAAAVVSTASATGLALADGAYRAALVGAATYLGSRLSLAVLAVVTVATAAFSGGQGGAGLAVLAAVGALVCWEAGGRERRSDRATGPAAVTAGCCAGSLLLPGASLPRGFSALGSAGVLLVVCALGYAKAPAPTRRRLRLLGAVAGTTLAVAASFGVVALVSARSSLQLGLSRASQATAQAKELDSQASGSMQAAVAAFEQANSRLRSPLGRAGTIVPLLGQQVRALDVASASGADLSRAGLGLAEAADPDALRIVDGRVPLERLEQAQPQAAHAAAAVVTAREALSRQRSPWLLPQLTNRLHRAQAQLAAAGDQADWAAALLRDIPPMLGSEGPRRYFVAVQTPSELRGSGGFMGSFAEIAAVDGRLTLDRTGRPSELNADRSTPDRTLDAPPDFLERYARFEVATTWESVTISPHFPSNAQVIRSLYPQSGGRPVDAVVAIDPFAIQAILKVVGPITVEGAPEPLTGENAAETLLFDQYRAFGDDEQDARHDYLAGAVRALTGRVLSGAVPLGPLAKTLQPMVDEKHLMASAGAAAEEPLFARLGLTGAMAPLRGDALAVVVQNAGASKIDWFLRRKVSYQATVDPRTGDLSATATIQLTNHAPATGLPLYLIGNAVGLPPGTSRMYVSVYSPLLLQGATLDGDPLLLDEETEQGRSVYSAFIDVPSASTITLELKLAGAVLTDVPYRLDLHRQPSAAPDEVTVTLVRAGDSGTPSRWDLQLVRDTTLETPLRG